MEEPLNSKNQTNALLTCFHSQASPFSKEELVCVTVIEAIPKTSAALLGSSSSYWLWGWNVFRAQLLERWPSLLIQLVYDDLINCVGGLLLGGC